MRSSAAENPNAQSRAQGKFSFYQKQEPSEITVLPARALAAARVRQDCARQT